jgi:hypothetical protein
MVSLLSLYHLVVYHHQITPLHRCSNNYIAINDHLWLLLCQLSKHHFFIQKVFLNRTQTCFEWLFKKSNVLSMMETIGSVTIETSPSDMNYQPPKALQAQTKNSAIKSAIQNKFEFDSKIPFE